MSWSCSGGTGTPFTDLSLWIWLKVCLCSSRFFKISCKNSGVNAEGATQRETHGLTRTDPSIVHRPTLCCSSFLCSTLAVSS